MDTAAWPAHPDLGAAHVHVRLEGGGGAPAQLGPVDAADRVDETFGPGAVRVSSQHRAQDDEGRDAGRQKWVVVAYASARGKWKLAFCSPVSTLFADDSDMKDSPYVAADSKVAPLNKGLYTNKSFQLLPS